MIPEDRGQRRHRHPVLLTERELNSILNEPFFSQPSTVNRTNYTYYRGRARVSVLTLRFNLIPSFDKRAMIRHLIDVLEKHFALQTRLLASVRYDFVLRSSQHNPPTFYVWRANTNQAEFDENDEVLMNFTHANIIRFCQNAADVHMPDLNIYFSDSNVVIDRCIAVVFSFVLST